MGADQGRHYRRISRRFQITRKGSTRERGQGRGGEEGGRGIRKGGQRLPATSPARQTRRRVFPVKSVRTSQRHRSPPPRSRPLESLRLSFRFRIRLPFGRPLLRTVLRGRTLRRCRLDTGHDGRFLNRRGRRCARIALSPIFRRPSPRREFGKSRWTRSRWQRTVSERAGRSGWRGVGRRRRAGTEQQPEPVLPPAAARRDASCRVRPRPGGRRPDRRDRPRRVRQAGAAACSGAGGRTGSDRPADARPDTVLAARTDRMVVLGRQPVS